MKTTINKLMSAVQLHLMILILLVVGTGAVILSSMATYERIGNLQLQERLIQKTLTLSHRDLAFARIETNGIIARLPILIDTFREDHFYEIINRLLIKESNFRDEHLRALFFRNDMLNYAIKAYFDATQDRHDLRMNLQNAVDTYILALHPLLSLQTQALYQYFYITITGIMLILVWVFIVIATLKHTTKTLLGDVHKLLEYESGSKTPQAYATSEFNTLAVRMRQQTGEIPLSSKTDPVTQLPKYEAVKSTFDQRFGKSTAGKVYLCVFCIDNYHKVVNHYPETVIDPILIKIASILKLHKHLNDIVSRIDESHFMVIFVRKDKQRAFSDCEYIRQMVQDNRFKLPHNTIQITLSGGFIAKSPSHTIDDAVKNAKSYLSVAEEKGGNYIAELKDNTKIL